MIVEISVIPADGDLFASNEIAEVVYLVDASGLDYQLTPAGARVEGDCSQLMELVTRCHLRLHECSPSVMTLIRMEDSEGMFAHPERSIA
ncbi:MAG: thiamine-binding protein [Anaerolineae bacterium]